MSKIVLDAMGGDYGVGVNVKAACLAVKENPNINVILVGRQNDIQKEVNHFFPKGNVRISIVNADETVEMNEAPTTAIRKKRNSSINIGLKLVKDHKADAFVSAGNTGAVMAASVFILGKIDGLERPAISTIVTLEHGPLVILDMGSNVDCRPNYLLEFAIMGSCFAKATLDIPNPRVGLLNIGEEPEKGDTLTKETFELLSASDLNFVGNVESKQVPFNKADVIVCDGFVGNTILKFAEGLIKMFFDVFKKEFKTSFLSKIGFLFLMPAVKRFKKKFDYEEFGGAPLLGVKYPVIISHGSSKEKALKNAIFRADQIVKTDTIKKMTKEFQNEISRDNRAR